MDRFARTAIDGVQTVRNLFERGVRVHILNMGLIENTLTGNLILTVMLAFAEYERGMIVERTQLGKSVARMNPDFKDGRPYVPLFVSRLTMGNSRTLKLLKFKHFHTSILIDNLPNADTRFRSGYSLTRKIVVLHNTYL